MTGHFHNCEGMLALYMELVSPVTNIVPGITAIFERTKPFPNLIHFSGLYPKSKVDTILYIDNQKKGVRLPWSAWDDKPSLLATPSPVDLVPEAKISSDDDVTKGMLIDLAYKR